MTGSEPSPPVVYRAVEEVSYYFFYKTMYENLMCDQLKVVALEPVHTNTTSLHWNETNIEQYCLDDHDIIKNSKS